MLNNLCKNLACQMFEKSAEGVVSKIAQWLVSITAGMVVGIETTIPFFVPCLLLTLIDVFSAYCLGRRLHKRYPAKADGKFKSEFKFRMLKTMILVFVAIILASYVDRLLLRDPGHDIAVRVVMWIFVWYQSWSILENWSSENENKLAKALQRVMVNKAERHLNVELSDIFGHERTNGDDPKGRDAQ